MKNIFMRLLLAAIAIPLILLLIFMQPQFNHLGWGILVMLASFLGAFELAKIFQKKGIEVSTTLSIVMGVIVPIVYWMIGNEDLPRQIILPEFCGPAIITIFIIICLSSEILNTQENQWDKALHSISAHLMILFYPIFLSTYLIRLVSLTYSSHILFTLILLIFTNDSFAYISGMLFGKKSWKPFPISPNKSIVGFVGGFGFTIAAGCLSYFLKPEVYNHQINFAITIAILISIMANIGDLVESSIKRSANIKDSGKIMLGRGGVLDSTDSLLFGAPILYLFMKYIIK